MSHVLKVIIGFTIMIAIGIGFLYYSDQKSINNEKKSLNNTGAVSASLDCISWEEC